MRALIVVAALVVMAGGVARADENPDITPGFMKANCHKDQNWENQCDAYFLASTNTLKDLIGAYHSNFGFCVPEGTWSSEATTDAFWKWLGKHPEHAEDIGSSAGIVLALKESYPCK